MFPTRAPLRGRLSSLLPLVLLAAAVIAPARVAATEPAPDATRIAAEELAMVSALNADRARAGLVAVRVDTRLMAIARARSDDMIAKHYFSHTQPDGRNIFDILTGQKITWYAAGEIIAWNNASIDTTTSMANGQWMNSPGHRAIVVSTNYNYVGVGLAVDASTGQKMWTAVFIKGPDRTGARAAVGGGTITAGPTASTRRVKIPWSGSDVRLQVLTAGLRSFTVQRRIDDGLWSTVWSSTTLKYATFTVALGHRTEIRVSAVDNKGNRGAWVSTVVDLR
jgi:uncharacterized protein YkwD